MSDSICTQVLDTPSILDHLDHRPQVIPTRVLDPLSPPTRPSLDCLGLDVWRYHLLLFCDLTSLLRVNWLNHRLRRMLNSAEFVAEYQSVCWYLQPRYCRCARNIFYLDLPRFLDFSYDYAGCSDSESFPELHTVRDASLLMRRLGRTPDMLVQSFQRSGNPPVREPLKVSHLDPSTNRAFVDGFNRMWICSTIIPMPRVVDHPVEQRRVKRATVGAPNNNERQETETLSEFEHRMFWREFHEVTDDMIYDVEMNRTTPRPSVDFGGGPSDHGFGEPEPCMVEEWFAYCAEHGLDPHDPSVDDAECRGFRAIRWARSKMFDSAVGGTSYPLELCLHREDLTNTSARLGVDYLDRMYVHLHRYRGGGPEWSTLDHRGVLYFMGVRYENAAEDFCTWCLSTQATLHGVYAHMWLDAMSNWTRILMSHLHVLACQVEEDLRFTGLQQRWRYLHSLSFAGPSVRPSTQYYTKQQRQRDQLAIHLLFDTQFMDENRYLSNLVDRGDLWTNEGDTAQRSRHFLTSLLEQYDQPTPNHRTESQRIQDAHRLIRFAEYLTDFAEYVGPRVDERTTVTRRRAFQIYLSSYVSMVLFCPGWKRTYDWRPSHTHEQTHWHVPTIHMEHNHRYQRYLNYCNRRTLFYHPDPSLLWRSHDQDATEGWRS